MDGAEPTLALDGRLELRNARHPLLIPAVMARIEEEDGEGRVTRDRGPVPIDIVIQPPSSVLVITGPNTGGMTVAIKTAGLLALMAQAGLHIPALEGSALPLFSSVFADIGDEQSISANLSTFSWHVTNIAAIDRQLTTPALVLFDEVGSGTDPVEGGALGMAVIDHFRQRGATIIATTHYDTLKTYASTTPGVACAAFGSTGHANRHTLSAAPRHQPGPRDGEKYGLAPSSRGAVISGVFARNSSPNTWRGSNRSGRGSNTERRLLIRTRTGL
jgi:DNA mismatch repair protein MutS2